MTSPREPTGSRLRLRLIEPDDAAYVHALRTDPRYNAHLSPVTGNVEDQRAWIEGCKAREAAGRELYYVIERLDGVRCGLVRLYDIGPDSFTWGSWILDENKPPKAALESAVLSFGVGFEVLGLKVANIDVRRDNSHAIAFYRRFGLTEVGADEENLYFEYTREQYVSAREADGLRQDLVDGRRLSGGVSTVDLPVVSDPRGDLTFVEGENHVPFPIRRVYYLYNVPVDAERGGHAHRQLEQVVFALSGSFRLKVDDGREKAEFWLRDPRRGVHINRLVWREMDAFSQGAVCMVLASLPYDEADYIRDYDEFLREASQP